MSFVLAPGELAPVIGANGAGKTTLLEAVVGRLRPAAGRVTYAGVRLDDLAQRARVFSFIQAIRSSSKVASVRSQPGCRVRVWRAALAGAAARLELHTFGQEMIMKRNVGLALWVALLASVVDADAGAKKVTFDEQGVGAPSPDFEPEVGDWYVAEQKAARGLLVDGSKWRQGTPSANLADQAKRLYGARYAEFLDGVKAFAFFPLAVYRGECAGDSLLLSTRFYPLAGRIDQGAGLAWNVVPDGSYFGARANALEDNLLFFKVARGKRTILENVRGVHTATGQWHTLSVALSAKTMTVELDGKESLKRDLPAPVSGRCGLWSKADSVVLFDDFSVTRLEAAK